MKNVLLGFPEEMIDRGGDYFCRPHPDYVAAVLIMHRSGSSLNVDIAPKPDGNFKSVEDEWQHSGASVIDVYNVDCPLQAQAIIQNFINNLEGNHER